MLTTSRDELVKGSDSIMKAIKKKEKLLMVSTGLTFAPGSVTEGTTKITTLSPVAASTTDISKLSTMAASSTEISKLSTMAASTTDISKLSTKAASSTESVATTTMTT